MKRLFVIAFLLTAATALGTPPTPQRLKEIATQLKAIAGELEATDPPAPQPPPPQPDPHPPPPMPPSGPDPACLDCLVPDLSDDPEAIEVKFGQTLTISGHRQVSTLCVREGGHLILDSGADLEILDRQPKDPVQMTVGLAVFGKLNGKPGAVVRSQNPSGFRGHTIFFHRADIDIEGVEFRDLGRTTVAPLNDMTNRIGRYAVHFHHLYGPQTTDKPYQWRMENCRVIRSPKWGIAIHDTHYGRCVGNYVEDAQGAGIVFEDGSETGNYVANNTVRSSAGRIRGSGEAANFRAAGHVDFGHEGAGIWTRSVRSVIENNQVSGYAVGVQVFPTDGLPLAAVPKFRGANTRLAEQSTLVDQRLPVGHPVIQGGTITDCDTGIEAWKMLAPDYIAEGVTVRGCDLGVDTSFLDHPRLKDCDIEADECVFTATRQPTAYLEALTLKGCRFKGRTGLQYTIRTSLNVEDCEFDCDENIHLWAFMEHTIRGGDLHFHNNRFLRGKPVTLHSLVNEMATGQVGRNESKYLLWPIRILFTQTGGQSFYLHFDEQRGDFVPPASVPHFFGSPEPGRTNAELAAKYGVSTFGYLRPANAMARPGFDGQAATTMHTALAPRPQIPVTAFLLPPAVEADGTITSKFPTDMPCQPLLAFDLTLGRYAKLDAPLATEHVVRFNLPDAKRWLVWVRGEQGQISVVHPRGVN
jgi:hypothetical protein